MLRVIRWTLVAAVAFVATPAISDIDQDKVHGAVAVWLSTNGSSSTRLGTIVDTNTGDGRLSAYFQGMIGSNRQVTGVVNFIELDSGAWWATNAQVFGVGHIPAHQDWLTFDLD